MKIITLGDIFKNLETEEKAFKFKYYITNLQTIEQQYSAILSENAELENKITNLLDTLKDREEYCYGLETQLTNLQEKLEVSQTNEETYRLEMQDITKILGLDEHTIFDEVKEYATNLQEEVKSANESITWWTNRFNALQEENKKLSIELNKNMIERNNYLSRNEKAIEYINKLSNEPNVFGHYGIDGNCKKYLLNILNGGDDNE